MLWEKLLAKFDFEKNYLKYFFRWGQIKTLKRFWSRYECCFLYIEFLYFEERWKGKRHEGVDTKRWERRIELVLKSWYESEWNNAQRDADAIVSWLVARWSIVSSRPTHSVSFITIPRLVSHRIAFYHIVSSEHPSIVACSNDRGVVRQRDNNIRSYECSRVF